MDDCIDQYNAEHAFCIISLQNNASIASINSKDDILCTTLTNRTSGYPCYVEILVENLPNSKDYYFLRALGLRPDGRSVKDKSVSNAKLVLS